MGILSIPVRWCGWWLATHQAVMVPSQLVSDGKDLSGSLIDECLKPDHS